MIYFCGGFLLLLLTFLGISDSSGGQIVEDVLTSGLSAKFMRHLRIRVLG